MAAQAPDPKSFASWEDAFAYPIPVVRKLETSLRSNINDNKDKVRSLVGSGYRDLLGTADRIIAMNQDMQNLEDVITGIGQKCNSRMLSRVAVNHAQLSQHEKDASLATRRATAEAALLQSSLSACQRIVKDSEGDLLLAARLVLLSRLLQNSANRTGRKTDSQYQRLKVGTHRNRVLARINARLGRPSITRAQMLDLLLAHALNTSSSLADAARNLLLVRHASITSLFSSTLTPGTGTTSTLSAKIQARAMTSALTILIATLVQARAVLPTRMSEVMTRATGSQLLSDEGLRTALEFDLDVYERWLTPDVQGYTAWMRRDDLDSSTLDEMLSKWADEQVTNIVSALEDALAGIRSPAAVAKMREAVLSHVLAADVASLPHFDRKGLVEKLRTLFATRLRTITTDRVSSIRVKVQLALDDGGDHIPISVGNLWDPTLGDMDLARGAIAFRAELAARSRGEDQRLRNLEHAVGKWTGTLELFKATVKSMRHARWEEDLEFDADEDDEVADTAQQEKRLLQAALGKEDPDVLAEHLSSEIKTSLDSCLERIEQAAKLLTTGQVGRGEAAEDARSRAAYLLRVLRIVEHAQHTQVSGMSTARLSSLSSALHKTIAASLIAELSRYQAADLDDGRHFLFGSTPATALWHGGPALPVQPTPRVYRFLKDVAGLMNAVGGDIWSAAAVDNVKQEAVGLVDVAIERALMPMPASGRAKTANQGPAVQNGAEATEASGDEGHGKDEDADDEGAARDASSRHGADVSLTTEQDRIKQMLFDTLYLHHVLSLSSDETQHDEAVDFGKVKAKVEMDAAEADRLLKSAAAYHKRSYLMFGILSQN